MQKRTREQKVEEDSAPQPSMDDVLKRMLSSPPKQHKDERVKPKPAVKTAQKKPAK